MGGKTPICNICQFDGVNTPSWPISGYQHYITAQSREVMCYVASYSNSTKQIQLFFSFKYNLINVNNLNSIDNSKMEENNKN